MATKEAADQEGDAKFIKGFIAYLKNGEALGFLSETFSGNVDKKVEPIESKIVDLEVKILKET